MSKLKFSRSKPALRSKNLYELLQRSESPDDALAVTTIYLFLISISMMHLDFLFLLLFLYGRYGEDLSFLSLVIRTNQNFVPTNVNWNVWVGWFIPYLVLGLQKKVKFVFSFDFSIKWNSLLAVALCRKRFNQNRAYDANFWGIALCLFDFTKNYPEDLRLGAGFFGLSSPKRRFPKQTD